jgi:hypothetical protein
MASFHNRYIVRITTPFLTLVHYNSYIVRTTFLFTVVGPTFLFTTAVLSDQLFFYYTYIVITTILVSY